MNNQYERVLTTDRAQELIQELFAGQTVPIKLIRTKVDEVHNERGGAAHTEESKPSDYIRPVTNEGIGVCQ